MKTLYQAFFNAERFWRDEGLAQLPAFNDPQADNIVEAMGEMQFVFTEHNDDFVLTSYRMNDVHIDYLSGLGYSFKNVCHPLAEAGKQPDYSSLNKVIRNIDVCSPYAVLPSTVNLCKSLNIPADFPGIEVVKKVNSKAYSTMLASSICQDHKGWIICSTHELKKLGETLLQSAAVLVKDTFGVSGKGNLLIENSRVLQSICRYLEKQEANGKLIELVVEPLLQRVKDFSCQLYINARGANKILSIQVMENNGFAYSGIRTADNAFYEKLTTSGYFDIVEQVASALAREGYFGPACIDSMLLKDDSLVPVVEINARKSMGLINYRLNSVLEQFGATGSLATFSFTTDQPITFASFFDYLETAGLLYQPGKSGLLPLSANTFDINHRLSVSEDQQHKRGRLYASVVAANPQEAADIHKNLGTAFEAHRLKIH